MIKGNLVLMTKLFILKFVYCAEFWLELIIILIPFICFKMRLDSHNISQSPRLFVNRILFKNGVNYILLYSH